MMTMSDKKRNRNKDDTKVSQPSPNTRGTKTQRQGVEGKKTEQITKDVIEKVAFQEKPEGAANLKAKFDDAADWKVLVAAPKKGWSIGQLPPVSPVWENIHDLKKKQIQGYIREDFTKWPLSLKDGLKNINFLYQVDDKKRFNKELSEGFMRDIDKMTNRNYSKVYKCLIELSHTEPTELPDSKVSGENIFVPHSGLLEMWIASINIFGYTKGSVKIPVVFSRTTEVLPMTQQWTERKISQSEGFKADEIFAVGLEGAHDWCRTVKNRFLKDGKTKEDWFKCFETVANKEGELNDQEQKALDLATKMALPDPELLGSWKGDDLQETEISLAWAGAYQLFGGVWRGSSRQGNRPPSALKTPRFSATTVEGPTEEQAKEKVPKDLNANPYYVERQPPVAPKRKGKEKVWKEVTYVKARLSAFWDRDSMTYGQAMTAVLKEWATLVEILCARDPSGTAVVAWSTADLRTTPLTKDSKKPANKDAVARIYTDEFYLTTRPGTQYIRFRLGHKKPMSFYLESDHVTNSLEEQGLAIYVDKIQDSNVSIAGWGAGPVVGRSTMDDIEAMLLAHPLMKANKIGFLELRVQQIRLHKGAWIKGEPRPLAVNFLVRARDAAKARKVLNTLYPSKPRKEYPGGVQWRFVTNIMDPYFPKTPNSVRKAKNLRAKQQQFQKDIRSTATMTIKNLHYRLPSEPYATLAQVIMNWRSSKDKAKRLFLHVEQTWEQTEVFYHRSVEREAETLVPLLPLILEQEYGPRAWNWFHDNAKDCLGGYEYDLETQKVTLVEEDINADVDEHWEQDMGEYNGEFSDDDDNEEGNAHVIDIGAIVLDAKDERHRILDDASVASMKSSAEAKRTKPTGWDDEDEMEVDKGAKTPSTLSSTMAGTTIEDMNPKEIEELMEKATEKLKRLNTITPTSPDQKTIITGKKKTVSPSEEGGIA
jgi:hypothetical protein